MENEMAGTYYACGEIRNAYTVFAAKLEEKEPFGRH
jgi:hypothetical protein